MKTILARVWNTFEFAAFYLREIAASNLRVAHDVLTPQDYMRPELIEVSTRGLTQRQLFALVNLVTMTPGSLCVDVDESGEKVVIHYMYSENPAEDARGIEQHFIRRIRNVF